MYCSFKRIPAILSAVLILLSIVGCNKKPKTELESETENSISTNIDVDVVEEDDSKDPENTENIKNEDGAKVDFAEVQAKKGIQNGIDVSKWQGKVDWQKVKNAGIDFAIIRIGYRAENGQIYRDSNAEYNIQQAQKFGILIGVYFFSAAANQKEAIEEAQWTVVAIKGYPISYPVVYDCEGFKNNDSRMHSLTVEQRTENALSFLDAVKKSGYEGMFYGSKSDLSDNTVFNIAKIEEKYKIWVAQYKNPPYPQSQRPDYNGRYDMWQYTNKGIVSGVEGNCDMVVSYFEKN
jgi:GH25 family lysozyme M1 (1,4-beta-N-acetylmuramidase)